MNYRFDDYSYVLVSDCVHVYADATLTLTHKPTGRVLTKKVRSVQFSNCFTHALYSMINEMEKERTKLVTRSEGDVYDNFGEMNENFKNRL